MLYLFEQFPSFYNLNPNNEKIWLMFAKQNDFCRKTHSMLDLNCNYNLKIFQMYNSDSKIVQK